MTGFRIQALQELTDQQVRFTPPARCLEHRARAEKLLAEIDPARQYPYQYVCYRVTEFRPEAYPNLLIGGADLAHDLRLMIQALLRPVEASPAAAGERLLTLEELARRLNVSTKTIRRWSARGLVGRRIVLNGRRQLGYPLAVVERFLAENREHAERGARFSQLTDEERDEIVRRAQRLARVGGSLTEVSRRIARKLGRSVEAVRCTIKNFDRENPSLAVFPDVTGPLDPQTKRLIYSSYRRGITVDTLANTYNRTRTSIYRVINEVRAQELLDKAPEYIYNPEFDDPEREAEILAPMPRAEEYEAKAREMKIPRDVPAELAPMYEVPLLDKDQEKHLFRQMNYLKHKANLLRRRIAKETADGLKVDPQCPPRSQDIKAIEDLEAQANQVKDRLIKANMRLVVNIAKKHASQSDNFFELLSDGNMSLIRAVEKFDYGRGFKFSTYASWAIMKNFARSIPDEKHRRERFVTGHEDVFEAAPDNRSDELEVLATTERASHTVNRLLAYLEPREREIIRMRAGLDDHAKGMTLEEIGQQFGITKERVRQLNARAMKKLRDVANEQHIEMPW